MPVLERLVVRDPDEPERQSESPAPPDRDAIAAILARGRQTRRPVSRGTWIAAAIVGGICLVAFGVAWFADASTASPPTAVPRSDGPGFAAGLVLGIVVGVVIGVAIARRSLRQSSGSDSDHSSRRSP